MPGSTKSAGLFRGNRFEWPTSPSSRSKSPCLIGQAESSRALQIAEPCEGNYEQEFPICWAWRSNTCNSKQFQKHLPGGDQYFTPPNESPARLFPRCSPRLKIGMAAFPRQSPPPCHPFLNVPNGPPALSRFAKTSGSVQTSPRVV